MPDNFKAIYISKTETGQSVEIKTLTDADFPASPEDNVTVAVEYSTVNYKDGLALTGKSPIIRSYPMAPGIDLAGTVTASADPKFKPGDKVLVNGYGLGENHWGGYAQRARLPGKFLVPVPKSFSAAQTMAIGTGGYTAMLCVLALEKQGVRPGQGEILVTGAAGGVGSVAIALLAKLGFKVVASTGRLDETGYLKDLGAAEVIDRATLSGPARALGKERWAGVVDAVGSTTLANAISQTRYEGTVTACGLAQGADLPVTVMPFILRGVKLIGVDSVMAPMAIRLEAWSRLARDLEPGKLVLIGGRTIPLAAVPQAASDILDGKIRGRVIVDVNG
ncbi:MAG: oxidoreductase [Alphaproteobacteria bacterium]|nr:oxidoreductase [Alphaproteobacteria bacterium]